MVARRARLLAGTLTLFLLSSTGAGSNPFEYVWQELAPGVWAGIRQDPFELPQEGNAVFVVTDRGVLLFDAGGSPSMGLSIVGKVRAVTDKPITHVVLSHWHGDHMRGLQAIQAVYPQVQVIAHEQARDRIVETRERWLKRRVGMVPSIRKSVRAALDENHDLGGRPLIPDEKTWLEKGLSNTDQLDRENQGTEYVIPAATFDRALRLYPGGREIDFLCLGSAHTAGDIVMWLPQEKIVATGDVVTAPIPLMPSPYVGDYPGVLDAVKALGFASLVPGHGPVEPQFTHGDPFLANRFEDYVRTSLADAAYLAATGKLPEEAF